jgi:hypothetical protein
MDLGSETWLEGWQGVDEGCGAPIAPHVSSTSHTYVLAGTSTLTVTGDGAFIGLGKAHNTGEDGKSGGAITYEIFDITPTTMKLTLDYSGGNKTNFWTIELVKQ